MQSQADVLRFEYRENGMMVPRMKLMSRRRGLCR